MKRSARRIVSLGLGFGLAVLLCAAAQAGMAPIPGGPRLADCAKARDPARCEARLEARRACGDKRGDTKRECMQAYLVAPDCARADDPKRCARLKQAEADCRGKSGRNFKRCLQTALRKVPARTTLPAPISPPTSPRTPPPPAPLPQQG